MSIDASDTGRRERKRRQTCGHLAATAFRLFEAEGYEQVTMEQIAAEADVAKGTLYKHFPVKEALIAHYFHNALAEDAPAKQAEMMALPSFRARMAWFLAGSAQWANSHRLYLPQYLQYRLAGAGKQERSGLDKIFEALIRAGQHDGELRDAHPPATLAAMIQFLYLGAMMTWLSQPGSELRPHFDTLLDVFLNGVLATPAGAAR